MPKLISDADMIYLRATPSPRALESMQQSFWGLYPPSTRTKDFPPPTMITRTPADETLFPNDGNCRRFSQLSRAFAQRTADRWNHTEEMEYLNKLIGKWMHDGGPVAIDSHPRLSGIMDTVNSTLAHPEETRLPKEFYDKRGREIMDRIETEEWFSGYRESVEYRTLGIGALLGDVVSRMVGNVENNGNDGLVEIGGDDKAPGVGRGCETAIKFALSGCHDTTLAAILASLGTFEGENLKWPPYTSHIALELFRDEKESSARTQEIHKNTPAVSSSMAGKTEVSPRSGLWNAMFGAFVGKEQNDMPSAAAPGIARRAISELDPAEKGKLEGYYVRMRYNDKPMVMPGCQTVGNHREGDESLCTLVC